LKGSPLAAKTVGSLLRKSLTVDFWTRVLESREWELQTGDNDIMPALNIITTSSDHYALLISLVKDHGGR
jgi:hypothetical protein